MQKISRSILAGFSLLVTGFFITSCDDKDNTPVKPTLYQRLGGVDSISVIVDDLIANVGAETSTPNSVLLRSHVDLLASTQPGSTDPGRLGRLRNNVIDQLGENSGGPLKYKGKNMIVAHRGMAITSQEFAVWRVQLRKSLDKHKVAATEQAEVLRIMDQMEADVIGK